MAVGPRWVCESSSLATSSPAYCLTLCCLLGAFAVTFIVMTLKSAFSLPPASFWPLTMEPLTPLLFPASAAYSSFHLARPLDDGGRVLCVCSTHGKKADLLKKKKIKHIIATLSWDDHEDSSDVRPQKRLIQVNRFCSKTGAQRKLMMVVKSSHTLQNQLWVKPPPSPQQQWLPRLGSSSD